ncbi:uncharacterized protein LOC133850372 [Drosophila sulfurigaster albostrigata]|uniref:uncharacterized protein LOC133850372 n=1 Tax=Drosophila sulfurigaster albostrigata TaxID=89887 RepID=UPI002D219FC6|nr:uncharacterized protein LOC133850372 [Drosophila sulfurigaster albostrigata]
MRVTISVICFLAIAISTGEGTAVVSVGNYKDDAHPNTCVFDENTIIDNFNSITRYCQRDKCIDGKFTFEHRVDGSPDHCQKISCLMDGIGHIDGCPNIVLPQGSPCTFGEAKYPNASFPDCCNTVVHCPDGDSESFDL